MRRIGCAALPHRSRRDVRMGTSCSYRRKLCCLRLHCIKPSCSSPLFLRSADQCYCIRVAFEMVHRNETVSKEESRIRHGAGPALRTAHRAALFAQLIAASAESARRASKATTHSKTYPKYPTQPPQKSNGSVATLAALGCKRTRASRSSKSVNNSVIQLLVSSSPN